MQLNRPDLHKPAQDFIAQVYQIQHAGKQDAIPLSSLITLFGGQPTPAEQQEIAQRPDLILDPTTSTFLNKGPAVQLDAGKVHISVPSEISGTYKSTADDCSFTFAQGNTISGLYSLLFVHIHANLTTVDINQATIQVGTNKSGVALTINHV